MKSKDKEIKQKPNEDNGFHQVNARVSHDKLYLVPKDEINNLTEEMKKQNPNYLYCASCVANIQHFIKFGRIL